LSREPLTIEEGLARAAKLVLEAKIPGLKYGEERRLEDVVAGAGGGFDGVSIHWERAWGVEATLNFNLREEKGSDAKVFGTEVSWSSTHRGVAQARAAVVLYGQVVDLAALLEAVLGGERFVRSAS
jgi:hypothetical protein